MPASEQLTEVEIDDLHQTEYKIINLKSDTKYIVYLLAVTIADGESTFVEDSTNVLAGLLFGVCHQFYLSVYASGMTPCCLALDCVFAHFTMQIIHWCCLPIKFVI